MQSIASIAPGIEDHGLTLENETVVEPELGWRQKLEKKVTDVFVELGSSLNKKIRSSPKAITDTIRELTIGIPVDTAKFFGKTSEQLFGGGVTFAGLAASTYALLRYVEAVLPDPSPDKISKLSIEPTMWETYEYTLKSSERSTPFTSEIPMGYDEEVLDEESIAKVVLMTMVRNDGRFQNQPFKISMSKKSGALDPRLPARQYGVAIRNDDGSYKTVRFHPIVLDAIESRKKSGGPSAIENASLSDNMFEVSTSVGRPVDCQFVIDNRNIPSEETGATYTQLDSAYCGISQHIVEKPGPLGEPRKYIEVNYRFDHMALDGRAMTEFVARIAAFSKTRPISKVTEELVESAEAVQPILSLNENVSPNFMKLTEYIKEKRLSSTEILRVYAMAMLEWGSLDGNKRDIKTTDTVLVPAVGKFNNEVLDSFNGKPHEQRIQLVMLQLGKMAENAVVDEETGQKYISYRFSEASKDGTSEALAGVFEAVAHPNMPKLVQRFFLRGTQYVPFYSTLCRVFNSKGLVSTPKGITQEEIDSEEVVYGTKARHLASMNIYGNTFQSRVAPYCANLFKTEFGGNAAYTISARGEQDSEGENLRFARILDRASHRVLEEAKLLQEESLLYGAQSVMNRRTRGVQELTRKPGRK